MPNKVNVRPTLSVITVVIAVIICTLSLMVAQLWSISPAEAAIRSIEEAPGQVMIQSRQTLRDDQKFPWQVVLFAHKDQLELRLVGFPDRDTFAHPGYLEINLTNGQQLIAEDEFIKKSPAANVGQFNLEPLVDQLPKDQNLVLHLPLTQEKRPLTIPAAVIIEWQALIQQKETL
jgi:hypothetical protein